MSSRILPGLSAFLLHVIAIGVTCVSLAQAADERNLGVATSGKRVALVIGNAAYASAPLKNPVNDARDMAAALRKLGFDVIEKTDATQKDMNLAIAQFGDKLRADTVALFFFAGHGMQVKGKNYIVPTDAQITSESTVRAMTVDVDTVMDQLAVSTMNIVILDACRNNPFERKFRSTGGGLAQMDAPKGSLIAYATAPGKVANDGDGRNGLYTQELLKHIQAPGLPLEAVFKRVRNGVMQGSGEAQTPWEASSLTGDFYFQAGTGTQGTQVASLGAQIVGGRSAAQIEDELWDAIKDGDRASVFEEYLKQYPKGRYLAQARVKIAKLKAEARQPVPAAVSPAPTFTATSSDPETALWSEVQKGHTADDYDVYLKQYPKGKYVALAKQRLQKLKDEARQQAEAAEQGAWQAAEAAQTPEGYAAYLASYPRGRYAALAQTRSNKLKADAAVQEESRLWQAADKGGKAEVDAYLGRYPGGRYASAAQLKLAQIRKEEAEMRPGKAFKDCTDCPEMVILPAGSFEMGSPTAEAGRQDSESPQHRVSIRNFAAGKLEVTRGQFAAFVKDSGHNAGNECYTFEGGKFEKRSSRNWQNPGYSQADSHPAVCVSWDDAKAYVAWLSRKTGKNYRLLSEAEWEYAARAGTSTARYWGESPDQACGYANVMDATGKSQVPGVTWEVHNCTDGHAYTAPGSSFKPNAFGLYDMIGNAWEWTEDCWNKTYIGAPNDGSAWTTGECSVGRVLRGGSWDYTPQYARSAQRFRVVTSNRNYNSGFRLARMLP